MKQFYNFGARHKPSRNDLGSSLFRASHANKEDRMSLSGTFYVYRKMSETRVKINILLCCLNLRRWFSFFLSFFLFLHYFIDFNRVARHAKTWLRAYTVREDHDQPSLSANRIIGFRRMYEWRAKARMILLACAGLSKSAHFAHVRRHFFA